MTAGSPALSFCKITCGGCSVTFLSQPKITPTRSNPTGSVQGGSYEVTGVQSCPEAIGRT